jgi:hypothetical protein
MTLKNGGKFDLKLGAVTPAAACYAAVLQISDASFRGQALVASEGKGKVDFEPWSGDRASEPPEWLLADVRAALKAALRSSQVEGRWPRRITRWRPEPSG